jgi:hypothetical protein
MDKILIERGTTTLDSVNPRIAVVKPATTWMSKVPERSRRKGKKAQGKHDVWYVHVDQNNPRDQTSAARGLYT